jgi:thiamine pyridinylase
MKAPIMRLFAISAACIALLVSVSAEAAPRRVLHVSLYPYIPDAADAALTLKQGFERLHTDVIVDITFNRNYYSPKPEDHGVLFEDADVHEIDVVFMRDFLAGHKLQPPGEKLVAAARDLDPLALQASTYDGQVMALPQWMCADFLIYRADKTNLAATHTLAAMEQALGPDHGLLLSMKGDGQLGELYLTSLLSSNGATPEATLAKLSPMPDPAILARLRRMLALEPLGLGRNAAYGENEGFYARQFARGVGAAFIGYSELIHEALDESANGCRDEDRCVTADQIHVTAFPFSDDKIRPTVWVDMFAIDARTKGQTLTDAQDFIGYAISRPAYRALLIPLPGAAPRYLLPAYQAVFNDPDILRAAPLYPRFHEIIDQGVVVTVSHLNATLHDVAEQLDAALPQVH